MTSITKILEEHDDPDWALRQVYEHNNVQCLSAAAQELVRRGWRYVVGSSGAEPRWTHSHVEGTRTTYSACGETLTTEKMFRTLDSIAKHGFDSVDPPTD